jgi:hypothetical protein
MTHVRHIGLKWMTHRFRYSTCAFNRIMHMKKRDLIPALLRSGIVESDSQREALILRAEKKICHILVPKLKHEIETKKTK